MSASNLQTLESREIHGHPDQIVQLKSELDVFRGRTEELRNELRNARVELQKSNGELAQAKKEVFRTIFIAYFLD